MGEHRVVLALAPPRARWIHDLGRWSNSGAAALSVVRCVSVAELLGRLSTASSATVVLVDGGLPGVDRDLVDAVGRHGAATVVVGGPGRRDWRSLGVAAVLPAELDLELVTATLAEFAASTPVARDPAADREDHSSFRAPLVAVTGVRGCGSSTVAIAAAQALATRPDGRGSVLLADLALEATLGLYHDAPDVVPALPELVEAHRSGRPDGDVLQRTTYEVASRGYSLLCGLRRSTEWTALPAAAVAATLDTLRSGWRWVVADCSPELDGEAETGSVDVEERHQLARLAIADATAVVVVGDPTIRGVRQLVRLIDDLAARGVAPGRLVVVVNRSPRSPAERARLSRSISALATTGVTPLHLGDRRTVELAHRAVSPLPEPMVRPLGVALAAALSVSAPQIRRGSLRPVRVPVPT